jgi:hypothetical protein
MRGCGVLGPLVQLIIGSKQAATAQRLPVSRNSHIKDSITFSLCHHAITAILASATRA